jgi:DNA replication protein DnaC
VNNKYIEKPSDSQMDLIARLQKESEISSGACSICKGLGGWTNDLGQYTFCECEKEKMFISKCAKANIPHKNLGKSLEEHWNLRQDVWGNNLSQNALDKKADIKKLVERYTKVLPAIIAGNPLKIKPRIGTAINLTSLLFHGGQWSGKSLLCTLIAQEAVRKNLSVEYIDWSELYSDLSGFENREKQNDWADIFGSKDLIILDGVDYYDVRNPSFVIQLDRVARARARCGKPIIITAYPGYEKIEAGHGWSSLLASCFKVTLPTPEPPKPYAS